MFKKAHTLFFWIKKARNEKQNLKVEQIMASVVKFLPQIKAIMNNNATPMEDGRIVGRMYDFFENYNGTLQRNILPWDGDIVSMENPNTPKDERIEATPKSVFTELETVPTPFTVVDLQEKIELMKKKTGLASQRYVKEQIDGMIVRLKNRTHYEKNRGFFEIFPNTTDEKIDSLLAKYKLEFNKSDLFVPTFPKDAIDIMSKYQETVLTFCDEKPVFYVIAEQKDFQIKRGKLDPILLVQSPFGFFWQILGAWDKEMLLLSEL